MATEPASLTCFDYLQQFDGITVCRLWQVFNEPERSPRDTSLFDSETERQIGLKSVFQY